MNRFKFYLVAIAATAMMFSTCKKDDENNTPESNHSNSSVSSNYKEKIVVSAPEVIFPKQYQYVGLVDEINFKWEKPEVKKIAYYYDENTKSYKESEISFDYTLKYEFCYSNNGFQWETSDKFSETEFKKQVSFEKDKTYYYKINTYISYGNTIDSLIVKYDYKYKDDVEIPFYSTYEFRHHIGFFMNKNNDPDIHGNLCTLLWDKDCDCKLTWCNVKKLENGEFSILDGNTKFFKVTDAPIGGTISVTNGFRLYAFPIIPENIAVKYVLSGKYSESGVLLISNVDGSKYISDGNFNIYPKGNMLNGKPCVVFNKNCKTQYNEDMFEYSESGRLKRYNPCTFHGRMVSYEDWKEFSNGLSDIEFMINSQNFLKDETATYPFLKNGEYMCFDKDYDGVDYEAKNFNNSCSLVEFLGDFDENTYKYFAK